MSYLDYISTPGIIADLKAKKSFLENLLIAVKQKNIQEGINIFQYLYLLEKTKNWVVTIPNGYPYAGTSYTINLMSTFYTGDIEMLAKTLDWGRSNCDDMSQSIHWLNEERLNWILNEIKAYLGWV